MFKLVKHLYLPNPEGAADLSQANGKIGRMVLALVLGNLAVWAWALLSLRDSAALLGTALLAYSFGLRHALDVDHIAAIDNVTRRLMHQGKKPVTVGLSFATGHSLVVILASLAIGLMAQSVSPYLSAVQNFGATIGNVVSVAFLLAIGLLNAVLLLDTYRKSGQGGGITQHGHHAAGGILSRLLRPLTGNIQSSWQMIPLGVLFGLGFETATEVAVLGTSALQASQGASLMTVLLFPCLFTMGMLTVDAIDGVLMLRVYGWAFITPQRKVFYNVTLTLTSTVLAMLIAGINIADMVQEAYQLEGPVWAWLHELHESYTLLGALIVAVFLASWLMSQILYRGQSVPLAARHPQ
ncbi:HoxN/HupN/NixA family nickel/cobalt transporter [Herbaspirillum huttiense]|uniref:HoxN/HupN/NixA family nickel/cobalt transporter n=1 Tax=Herbaspirillum huttiense TaxID=863372 RepID=UPI0039B0844C